MGEGFTGESLPRTGTETPDVGRSIPPRAGKRWSFAEPLCGRQRKTGRHRSWREGRMGPKKNKKRKAPSGEDALLKPTLTKENHFSSLCDVKVKSLFKNAKFS